MGVSSWKQILTVALPEDIKLRSSVLVHTCNPSAAVAEPG